MNGFERALLFLAVLSSGAVAAISLWRTDGGPEPTPAVDLRGVEERLDRLLSAIERMEPAPASALRPADRSPAADPEGLGSEIAQLRTALESLMSRTTNGAGEASPPPAIPEKPEAVASLIGEIASSNAQTVSKRYIGWSAQAALAHLGPPDHVYVEDAWTRWSYRPTGGGKLDLFVVDGLVMKVDG